ncbi:MAG: hypothetical protein M5U26_21320 [Planctomycetota bacterium]|nr:hypothetical protein [Planctomycetota bacterium]
MDEDAQSDPDPAAPAEEAPHPAGELKDRRSGLSLFFEWTSSDVIQTIMFLGWVGCVCFVMSEREHLVAAFSVGIGVALNYAFLAIYHVNSIGAKGGERVKNIALIYLAPSVFMGILAILSLVRS